jgi:hypothetical protein
MLYELIKHKLLYVFGYLSSSLALAIKSTQLSQPNPMLLCTAVLNLAIFLVLSSSDIWGSKMVSTLMCDCTSSRDVQKPTLRPAAIAAPAEVISFSTLRSIFALLKFAYVYIMRLFTVIPPSTLIFVTLD